MSYDRIPIPAGAALTPGAVQPSASSSASASAASASSSSASASSSSSAYRVPIPLPPWERTDLPPLPSTIEKLCDSISVVRQTINSRASKSVISRNELRNEWDKTEIGIAEWMKKKEEENQQPGKEGNVCHQHLVEYFARIFMALESRVFKPPPGAYPGACLPNFADLAWSILEAMHSVIMRLIDESFCGDMLLSFIISIIQVNTRYNCMGLSPTTISDSKTMSSNTQASVSRAAAYCESFGFFLGDFSRRENYRVMDSVEQVTVFLLTRPLHRDPAKAMALVKAWIGSPYIQERYAGPFVQLLENAPLGPRTSGTLEANTSFVRATLLSRILLNYSADPTRPNPHPHGYQLAREKHWNLALEWVFGPESNLCVQIIAQYREGADADEDDLLEVAFGNTAYFERAHVGDNLYFMAWFNVLKRKCSDGVIQSLIWNHIRIYRAIPAAPRPNNADLMWMLRIVQLMAINAQGGTERLRAAIIARRSDEITELARNYTLHFQLMVHDNRAETEKVIHNLYADFIERETVASAMTRVIVGMTRMPLYIKPGVYSKEDLVEQAKNNDLSHVSERPQDVYVAFTHAIYRAIFFDLVVTRFFCTMDGETLRPTLPPGLTFDGPFRVKVKQLQGYVGRLMIEQFRFLYSRKLHHLIDSPNTHLLVTRQTKPLAEFPVLEQMRAVGLPYIRDMICHIKRRESERSDVLLSVEENAEMDLNPATSKHLDTLMMIQKNLDVDDNGSVHEDILTQISELMIGPTDVYSNEDGTDLFCSRELTKYVSQAIRERVSYEMRDRPNQIIDIDSMQPNNQSNARQDDGERKEDNDMDEREDE